MGTEKTEKKKEGELSEATQFDIMSKKIVCKFFANSLFTRLSVIDYEGQVKGQGDAVQMVDHTIVVVDRAIPIKEERDLSIFEDIVMIDLVTTRIAKQLKEEVEETILKASASAASVHDGMVLLGKKPPEYVHGRLYFVCQIVPMGGFKPKGYGMKFVYGFKIG